MIVTVKVMNTTIKVLVAQSCPALCGPLDYSPPGSSVHGILQARMMQWVAISSSKDLPDPGIEPLSPGSPALQAGSLPAEPHWSGFSYQ